MDKLSLLEDKLRSYKKICVGFSGGVDSSFLLKVAKDVLGDNVLAIIVDGGMLPRRELAEAIQFAEKFGIAYCVLPMDPLQVPEFRFNDKKRCYHCKKEVFSTIKQKALELGFELVADGKNVDDTTVYRPGHEATQELGIVSPLYEAGFTKGDIRDASKRLGLSTWDKPSNACLATRFPYDTEITQELMKKVEEIEELLNGKNMIGCRARIHGEILRIETQRHHFDFLMKDEALISQLKEFGFKYICLDLEGFRSGSMD